MNKLSKPLLAGVLIVSSLGLSSMASAMPFDEGAGCWRGGHQMGAGHKHGGQGFNIERMANKLDLTDDQSARIGAILEESRQQMGDLHDKMQGNREQMRGLMQQSPLNEAAIRTVADTQGDVKADMIVLRAQQHAKINSILTDDQRAQLKEMRGKRRRDR
jgi:Spy/CpxP family protein refolding chaperone